jgi:hypothetical protein
VIGYLKLGGIALAVLAVVSTGAYFKGRGDGADKIQAQWDADKLVAAEAFRVAVANTEAVKAERDTALKEITDDLKPKLEAAESAVGGLARRLRLATQPARDCPVPGDPASAGTDSGPGGIPDSTLEIERDADEAWRAAARDSARLTACQVAYDRVRRAGRD